MSDLVELPMIEHSSIRHISRYIRTTNEEDLAGFHEYLTKVHIEIEEKIVFPLLAENADEKSVISTLNQLRVDHKSIDELANGIFKLWSGEDKAAAIDKNHLYFRLLRDHNDSEDTSIFPLWKSLEESEIKSAMKEANNVIEAFGRDLYVELMGLSTNAYVYFIT